MNEGATESPILNGGLSLVNAKPRELYHSRASNAVFSIRSPTMVLSFKTYQRMSCSQTKSCLFSGYLDINQLELIWGTAGPVSTDLGNTWWHETHLMPATPSNTIFSAVIVPALPNNKHWLARRLEYGMVQGRILLWCYLVIYSVTTGSNGENE